MVFFKILLNLGLQSGSSYYYSDFWFFFFETEEIEVWVIFTSKTFQLDLHLKNYDFTSDMKKTDLQWKLALREQRTRKTQTQ